MKNQLLKQFYDNEGQREAVKVFMLEVLKELAVEKTFTGHPITGIKEAHELVNKMFDKLAELYAIIDPPITHNSR